MKSGLQPGGFDAVATAHAFVAVASCDAGAAREEPGGRRRSVIPPDAARLSTLSTRVTPQPVARTRSVHSPSTGSPAGPNDGAAQSLWPGNRSNVAVSQPRWNQDGSPLAAVSTAARWPGAAMTASSGAGVPAAHAELVSHSSRDCRPASHARLSHTVF